MSRAASARGRRYRGALGETIPISRPTRTAEMTAELREVNQRLLIAALREQQLAEASARLAAQMSALLGSLAEGVIVMDASGKVLVLNEAAREILGPLAEAPSKAEAWRLWPMCAADGTILALEDRPIFRALRGERFSDVPVSVTPPGGQVRRLMVSGSAVLGSGGEVVLALCVARDVTELQALEQLKEEYVALISHDLRSPLSTVTLAAQRLVKRLDAAGLHDDARNADRIVRSAGRMNALIEDLIDCARAEQGQLELEKAPVELATLVREVTERLPGAVARVAVECPEPLPPVLADADCIDRVLTNLLGNALKYSPPAAPVRVRIARSRDSVTISVIDQGPGIAPDEVPHLFERFYRARATCRAGGTGLGLYIASLLTKAHGGRISVESEVGKGSAFHLTLPL
jgi:PAS domain S-box-containing protein